MLQGDPCNWSELYLHGSWANPLKKDWVLLSFRNLGLSSSSTEIHNKCSRAVLILDSYLMVKRMNTLVREFLGKNLQQLTTSQSSRSNIPLEPEHGTSQLHPAWLLRSASGAAVRAAKAAARRTLRAAGAANSFLSKGLPTRKR